MEIFPKIMAILSDIATICAIVVGGIWTYRLFVKKREDYARAVIKQEIEEHKILPEKYLLRVTIYVQNIGSVAVYPTKSITKINKITPLTDVSLKGLLEKRPDIGDSDDTILWPDVFIREQNLEDDDFYVEPGETEQIWTDFIVDDDTQIIQIYSKVYCGKKYGNLYWDAVKVHKFE
jgi:hypothetical protein